VLLKQLKVTGKNTGSKVSDKGEEVVSNATELERSA
jgi:hypothetical protein